jgi:phosphopantothenoylcysteine decarboxylase / phosphopantothenate---cysteine ligase
VSPVLTQAATRFVGELTFTALASERARTSLWGNEEPIPHTRLGQAADLVLVAPATARLIGAYAAGISSDLLTATLLATRAPVLLAPAMHTEMWEHPAVVDNIATLRRRGVHLVGPDAGRLAGGDLGYGRLASPEAIVDSAIALLTEPAPPSGDAGDARGLRALVTAGGTREPIDAVRYIGNRSSGKQGHAIATELARRGAAVTLVTASELPGPAGVDIERVETAAEMHEAVTRAAPERDLIVMSAAVADFRPKVAVAGKLKKADGVPEVILEQTPDILAGLGATRRPGQILVGFAAEALGPISVGEVAGSDFEDRTAEDRLRDFAEGKLRAKGADLIVANDVSAPGVGFAHDTNAVLIVTADGLTIPVPLADKGDIAAAVVDAALAYRLRRSSAQLEKDR